MQIQEKKENKKRGVMALYALPDTRKLGLTEAQAYAVVWDTFQKIQRQAPRVEVYYGQDTGEKRQKGFMDSRNECFIIWMKLTGLCFRAERR